jgi:hypothetical protein
MDSTKGPKTLAGGLIVFFSLVNGLENEKFTPPTTLLHHHHRPASSQRVDTKNHFSY